MMAFLSSLSEHALLVALVAVLVALLVVVIVIVRHHYRVRLAWPGGKIDISPSNRP
jgi:hypothetical protein